eukprot:scaffold1384_cov116-Cylindrotheca_fusiformis.AAC.27
MVTIPDTANPDDSHDSNAASPHAEVVGWVLSMVSEGRGVGLGSERVGCAEPVGDAETAKEGTDEGKAEGKVVGELVSAELSLEDTFEGA